MDTIKKKMLALKAEKENALDSKDAAEAEMRAAQEREEKANDQIKELQGRIKQLEEELDTTGEKLHETEVKCEEALKAQSNHVFSIHVQRMTALNGEPIVNS
ncbi:uncharacterized protein [Amphiura filiformis]|uniref:uncharacterized protein n=1 Tax=Amphiura filiformis TaxID=82378 RepID=UPI003B212667